MNYPAINYTWKYKFIILSIFLLIICIFQNNLIKNQEYFYSNTIKELQSEHMKQKNILLERIRNLEISNNKQN